MGMQVTRDRLVRDFEIAEKVEASRQTGSGYPGGTPKSTLHIPAQCAHLCLRRGTAHMLKKKGLPSR